MRIKYAQFPSVRRMDDGPTRLKQRTGIFTSACGNLVLRVSKGPKKRIGRGCWGAQPAADLRGRFLLGGGLPAAAKSGGGFVRADRDRMSPFRPASYNAITSPGARRVQGIRICGRKRFLGVAKLVTTSAGGGASVPGMLMRGNRRKKGQRLGKRDRGVMVDFPSRTFHKVRYLSPHAAAGLGAVRSSGSPSGVQEDRHSLGHWLRWGAGFREPSHLLTNTFG